MLTFCYNCHDGSVSSFNVQAASNQTYNHQTGTDDCQTCHDQHMAEPGLHIAGSNNPADMIGGVNKGLGFSFQYEICFQCHNTTISKTTLTSENNMDSTWGANQGRYATFWSTIPDIQSQFAASQLAYHPLFAAGRNQPADNLNSQWSSSSYRKDDTAPGGPFNGLDNNFVDGWTADSLVTCADCHNNAGAGASGPHGSTEHWITRGMDLNVTVTTAGSGTISPNQSAPNDHSRANLCVSCHRADIYGWGTEAATPTPNNENFARSSHLNGTARTQCTQSIHAVGGSGGLSNISCKNCHGGGEVTGIHGSSLGVGTVGASEQGKRFMNGNSKPGHTLGDVSGNLGCYTGTPPAIGQLMSSCSRHGNAQSESPNYYYPWQ
jgi:hypothetical protein